MPTTRSSMSRGGARRNDSRCVWRRDRRGHDAPIRQLRPGTRRLHGMGAAAISPVVHREPRLTSSTGPSAAPARWCLRSSAACALRYSCSRVDPRRRSRSSFHRRSLPSSVFLQGPSAGARPADYGSVADRCRRPPSRSFPQPSSRSSSGRRVAIRNDGGDALGEIHVPSDAFVLGAADWPTDRAVIVEGRPSAR